MDLIKNTYITPDEYERLQDTFECKTEYSNGTIIMHSNTGIRHNKIVTKIARKLGNFFEGSKCDVYTEQIEVIFDEFHKYKPDIFVMCDNDRNKLKGESFIAVPKIIFEVISRSTAGHDRVTKLQVYKKYGVLEYVMVESDDVFTQCTLVDGEYTVKEYELGDEYISSVFPTLKFKLDDVLN